MKVLHVIPTLDHVTGGPSLALAGFAEALGRRGVDVTVAVDHPDPDDPALLERLRGAGVRVIAGDEGASDPRRLAGHVAPGASDPRRLAGHVAGCDVCHIHAVWERIQHRAAVACRRLGRPHLFRPCGMLDPWCLRRKPIRKKLYIAARLRGHLDRCSAIHFTTATERDLVRPLGFRAPTIVEPNGIDLSEFAEPPDPGSFRAAWPALADRPYVLFMSRLHSKKGLDLLVPAFDEAAEPEIVLVIAGPDEEGTRARLEADVARLGLGARVIFTGLLRGPERVAALAGADLFVLPSYQENFGVVVVEALAAGTPVIVSDQVNIHRELAAAGVGLVVPAEVGPLAEALRRWLADADDREAAAARARPFVAARYDLERIAERWRVRYERLAAGALPDDAEVPAGSHGGSIERRSA